MGSRLCGENAPIATVLEVVGEEDHSVTLSLCYLHSDKRGETIDEQPEDYEIDGDCRCAQRSIGTK